MSHIPSHAKKVFSSKLFEFYEWEQELFDGRKAIFESVRRHGGVQVIPVYDGKILLSHEEQPGTPKSYGFIGGRIDSGEDSFSAAKRELLEETGMVSKDWEHIDSYSIGGNFSTLSWEVHLYIARGCKKVAEPMLEGGEKIDIVSVDFDEFFDKVAHPDFRSSRIALELLRMKHQNTLQKFKERIFK